MNLRVASCAETNYNFSCNFTVHYNPDAAPPAAPAAKPKNILKWNRISSDFIKELNEKLNAGDCLTAELGLLHGSKLRMRLALLDLSPNPLLHPFSLPLPSFLTFNRLNIYIYIYISSPKSTPAFLCTRA
jgi:hypothetical protein